MEIDPKAADALLGPIKAAAEGLMPAGGVQISKVGVISTRPYGVTFDVSADAFFGLKFSAGGVRITQNGVTTTKTLKLR